VEAHPVAAFVERGLARAEIDPVLARHGELNWSFYSGSAPIQIWSCCSEHAPYVFDLDDNLIRLSLTVHASDIFSHPDPDELVTRMSTFIAMADRLDNHLIDTYGCVPA